MKITLSYLFLALVLLSFQTVSAQKYWGDVDEREIALSPKSEVSIQADHYRTLSLDIKGITELLRNVPVEFSEAAERNPVVISLPMPDGSWEEFKVVQSPVMMPELAGLFPSIRSYKGYGTANRQSSVRFDISPKGFHALMQTGKGEVYIDPYASGQTEYYISYFRKDIQIDRTQIETLACGFDPGDFDQSPVGQFEWGLPESGHDKSGLLPLRTYRMALVCTGEYGSTHGGTRELVMSTFNTAMNRLNSILESETGIRMVLITGNQNLIFTNPDQDPFLSATFGGGLLDEIKEFLNSAIGEESYDIGHIFTNWCSDVGGVAGGTACSVNKAKGVTCHFSSNVDAVARGTFAHEVGHQLSAGHSWNNCPSSIDQRASGSAMEPGSGSTIMSYNGACGDQNIPGGRDAYYNIASLQEIIWFSRLGSGRTCAQLVPAANHEPEASLDYENGFYIPVSTPFQLTGTATDVDGDELTYCWEQHDLGPIAPLGEPEGTTPLFRSFPPGSTPTRIFPRMATIVNNETDVTEWLPDYSRDLSFTFTVRDNNPEVGATVWEEVKFKATDTAGPFLVTHPDTNTVRWTAGDYTEVTWEVANTDNELVNCQYVDIKLSVDGGYTYSYTLLEKTVNDGSAQVSVPNITTSLARIGVFASDNIFFDISNANFHIDLATEPGVTFEVFPSARPRYCLPAVAEFSISTASILGYDSTLTLDLSGDLPEGASYSFSDETIVPPAEVTLFLDLGPQAVEAVYDLSVLAITPGADTLRRDIQVVTVSNDFSGMALLTPADGVSDIIFSTPFSWAPSADANTYDFELATSPAFGSSTLESASGLNEPDYEPENLLEENTLYYWRVRPVNECGPGTWLEPFSFQTVTIDCVPFQPGDVPVNISGTGTPTIESTLFVETEGVISDLNVSFVKANFQPVSSLRVSLISPADTEVVLFDQNCGNTLNLRLGFDDEALSDIICPPDDGIVFRPVESLSAFIGENTFGLWTLRVKVAEPGFGASGALEQWNLEFCASRTPVSPALITNDTLFVPPGESNTITSQLLEVRDEDNTAEQLTYTIVTPPANGTLYRYTQPLTTGSTFRQATINAFNLSYLHDGGDDAFDSFTFVVEDGTGGWIPIRKFNIAIDEDAVVSTENPEPERNKMIIYPNPTNGHLNILFNEPLSDKAQLSIYNTQGQKIREYSLGQVEKTIELNLEYLNSGMYYLILRTESRIFNSKLIVR